MGEITNEKAMQWLTLLWDYLAVIGLRLLTAIALWIVGRWLIGFLVGLLQRALTRQKFDPTVLRYVGSFVTVTLNIILVIALLGYCGVETTSFAALLAAVGLAIGMAWSGLLANLAAGGFLIVLRPFKVGDVIGAGGVVGIVTEIGLFVTAINTDDNILTLVGNNRIFADNIQNFSHNPYRRVDISASLAAHHDEQAVIALLKQRIAAVPNVLAEPSVQIQLQSASSDTLQLLIRPHCHHQHYWSVYYSTQALVRETLQELVRQSPQPVR